MEGTSYEEDAVTLSYNVCEGCGKMTRCVITLRPPSLRYRLYQWREKRFLLKNGLVTDYIYLRRSTAAALEEIDACAPAQAHPQIQKARGPLAHALAETLEEIG